jgi:hypothetical protein
MWCVPSTGEMLLCPDCPYESASTTGLHNHKMTEHNHQPKPRNRASDEPEPVNFGSSSQLVAPAHPTMFPQVLQSQHQGGVSQENFKPSITSNAPPVHSNNVDIPPDPFLDYNTGASSIASGTDPVHSDMKPHDTASTYYPSTMPSPTIMGPASGTILREYEGPIHGDDLGAIDRLYPHINFKGMKAPNAAKLREGLARYLGLSEEVKKACINELVPDRFCQELGSEEVKYLDFVDEFFGLQA